MKTLQIALLVILPLVFTGCSKPSVDVSKTVERDEIRYLIAKDGTSKKPYSGTLTRHYENGQLESKGIYKDGRLHGPFIAYYENGQLKVKSTLKDGQTRGPIESYYENGQLKSKGTLKDGQYHGLFESYYENGQLKSKGTYKDGELLESNQPSPESNQPPPNWSDIEAESISNLKSVYVAILSGHTNYDAGELHTMSDLLKLLAKSSLIDTDLFLVETDLDYIAETPPIITAINGELYNEIFNYPISFSFAVYPDLKNLPPTVPLFWTRGLHRYKDFDQPYGGFVVYSNGSVEYYHGTPNRPNEKLSSVFGKKSKLSQARRIVEHEPKNWNSRNISPLPVRIEALRTN